MYDRNDDTRPKQQRNELEKQVMRIPSSEGGLNRLTYDAKQDLRAQKGLPSLTGSWVDLTTHYSYAKALEEGGHGLDQGEVKALGHDLSHRMEATLRILEKENLFEPMGFGFREKLGTGNSYLQGVSYVPDMRLFVITNSSLAYGDAQRRVFTPDEFYDIYEPPEEWR